MRLSDRRNVDLPQPVGPIRAVMLSAGEPEVDPAQDLLGPEAHAHVPGRHDRAVEDPDRGVGSAPAANEVWDSMSASLEGLAELPEPWFPPRNPMSMSSRLDGTERKVNDPRTKGNPDGDRYVNSGGSWWRRRCAMALAAPQAMASSPSSGSSAASDAGVSP